MFTILIKKWESFGIFLFISFHTTMAANLPPVIKFVIASPNSISQRQTSQLLVDANDPDKSPLPLKYNWLVPSGAGKLNKTDISNPVYTPPEVNNPQNFTLKIEVSDGNQKTSGKVDIKVVQNFPPQITQVTVSPESIYDFETSQLTASAIDQDNGPSTLSYNWIVPSGGGTLNNPAISNPIYTPPKVSGTQVFRLILNVSDGKDTVSSFVDIPVTGNIPPIINSVTVKPETIMKTQTSQLLVSATDNDNGPSPLTYTWIAPPGGGNFSNPSIPGPTYIPPDVSGDQTFTLQVNVSDGQYTQTGSVNVTVKDNYVLFSSFDSNSNGFIYVDNPFNNTTASGYARGIRTASAGVSGGALQVVLGDTDSTTVINMSGGWQRNFYTNETGNIVISFRYNMTMSADYGTDEFSDVMATVDGIPFRTGVNESYARTYGTRIGANQFIERMYGNGTGGSAASTGWREFTQTVFVTAGLHSLTIGGYNNAKTGDTEATTILFDNVSITKE